MVPFVKLSLKLTSTYILTDDVKLIWNEKKNQPLHVSTWQKLFGYDCDVFLTYLLLLLKYYKYNKKITTPFQRYRNLLVKQV